MPAAVDAPDTVGGGVPVESRFVPLALSDMLAIDDALGPAGVDGSAGVETLDLRLGTDILVGPLLLEGLELPMNVGRLVTDADGVAVAEMA